MWSRGGKRTDCPEWFVSGLPHVQLDGELWLGRDNFEILQAIYHKTNDPHWNQIEYHVFDLAGSQDRYEERMDKLEALKPLPAHVHIVERSVCRDNEYLLNYLDLVLSQGGEGLMLRQPQSMYKAGIVNTLLKVKVSNVVCCERTCILNVQVELPISCLLIMRMC